MELKMTRFLPKRAEKKVRHKHLLMKLENLAPLYIMLLPAVVYLLIFAYYPMYGAQIAFKDFKFAKGILDSPWVGIKHFVNFFNSYQFSRVIVNTLALSVYSILASMPVRIILSLSLNCVRSSSFKKTVQTITYMPHFIATVVMVGILLRFFNPHLGIISKIIQFIGGTDRDLFGLPEAFSHLYVWSGIWQNAGWGTIIFLATLAGVDPCQHEAALIDGASRLKRIWYIDLPAILPTAVIMLILDTGHVMSVGFEKVFLMQNSLNLSASEVISTYVYKVGIASGSPNYSMASAIGLFNSSINLALIIIVNSISKMLKQATLW